MFTREESRDLTSSGKVFLVDRPNWRWLIGRLRFNLRCRGLPIGFAARRGASLRVKLTPRSETRDERRGNREYEEQQSSNHDSHLRSKSLAIRDCASGGYAAMEPSNIDIDDIVKSVGRPEYCGKYDAGVSLGQQCIGARPVDNLRIFQSLSTRYSEKTTKY